MMNHHVLMVQLCMGTLLYFFYLIEELLEVNTYRREYLMQKALQHNVLMHSGHHLTTHIAIRVGFIFMFLVLKAPGPALALTVWWAFMGVVCTFAYYHQHPWKRT